MDDILLTNYDPAWPLMYATEAARVSSALPLDLMLAIEHFGSTAIPGMVAKPIIDLLVAVRSIQEAREVTVKPMEALGYAFWADNPRQDRLFFVKGLPPSAPHRTHHVHMTELGGDMWRHRLLFRDYLRSHSDEGQRYAELKRHLADQHSHDREAYTAAKSEYVNTVIAKAVAQAQVRKP